MLQDSPQFHELYPSSCSDLVEVVSEVTDSQPETAMAQVSPQPDGSFWYWTSDLVEEVEEATESEAVRLLAARIPPELFDDILFYVNVNRASRRKYEGGESLQRTRNRGELSARDILTDLKQCSLVCCFWANRCRDHMFSRTTLQINSYEDAEILRQYVVGGCPRLTPVNQLIGKIEVYQDYKSRRSFLHLLYLPVIQDKLCALNIYGPVPDGFNPAKLDTPHWSIPPSILVPSSFLQHHILVTDVRLPSFYHVAKYIRHFTCATYIKFKKITWDGQTPTYSLPQASNTITCQRRPRSLRIDVLGVCTNAVHLALTALMLNPNCPLNRLSDEECVWIIKFMTLLWGDKKDPDVWHMIEFNVSEQATTMHLDDLFHFVFEETPASADRSVSSLSVVGMHAYIDNNDGRGVPANFDALVGHASTQPAIRALVLLFDSLNRLKQSLKPFVEVLALTAETIELVLAYEEAEEEEEEEVVWACRAVGVDLATLEPNGCIDTLADRQSEDYWGTYLTLEMLQRQLKKKRWISVH